MTAATKRPATRPVPLTIEPPRRERDPRRLEAWRAVAVLPGSGGEVRPSRWFYGGIGDYFTELNWTRRPPDLARSGAPQALCDAWVATAMAVQEAHGGLRRGSCYYLNLAGAPLVQKVLGEPVQLCAGYGGWIEHAGRIETGFRWVPRKWMDWIDPAAGAHLAPTQDVHCWLETATHLIDLDGGTGDASDTWPPIIYREKRWLPKHPRDARGVGAILLWRNGDARELVGTQMVPIAMPIAAQAVEFYDTFVNGTLDARREAEMRHRMTMDLARRIAPDLGIRLASPDRAAIGALEHRRLPGESA